MKNTDRSYKSNLRQGKKSEAPPTLDVYIFGHSLDITDRDVLKEILEAANTRITIYAKNRETMGQQVINLVRMIGQDNLIDWTSGSKPFINFVLQDEIRVRGTVSAN